MATARERAAARQPSPEAVEKAQQEQRNAASEANEKAWAQYEEQRAAVEEQVQKDREAAEKAEPQTPGEAKVLGQTPPPLAAPSAPVPPPVPDLNREPLPGEPKLTPPESGTNPHPDINDLGGGVGMSGPGGATPTPPEDSNTNPDAGNDG